MDIETVVIRTSEIRLDSLLKFAGLADSGGAAKVLIQSGRVQVNGEWEQRRSRTVSAGDRIDLCDDEGQLLRRLTIRHA